MWLAYPLLVAALIGYTAGFICFYRVDWPRRLASQWRARRECARIMARTDLDYEIQAVLATASLEVPQPVDDWDTSGWLVIVDDDAWPGDQR